MIKRICKKSEVEFEITKDDLEFYEKMGVITANDLQKLVSGEIDDCVGLPTLCPEERQRRRILFRNFTKLYTRKCDVTQKLLISIYDETVPFPVYENSYWWSDSWDALDFGREIDFGRDFFDQFSALQNIVPRFATYNTNSDKCDYSTAFSSNNCYLIGGCVRNQDCAYGHIVWDSSDCFDNLYVSHCQWCSNCIDVVHSYETHFSSESANCSNCYFVHDCRNCEHCFACTNLRNKKYCFLNEQLTKEVYEKKMSEIMPFSNLTVENGWKWLSSIKLEKTVFPAMFGLKNESCEGNHIYESKNCMASFDAKKSEDSKFLYTSYNQECSYDISFTGQPTKFTLEGLSVHGSVDTMFCFDVHNSNNMRYSSFCINCSDCFGCVGLRHKKYCILNKQYTKEEYEALVSKIIAHMKKTGEWGEFFPASLSPFAYNETVANEYFPLTKSEALEAGYGWKEEQFSTKYKGDMHVIPDDIKDVPDEIVKKVLKCERSGKFYRIQKAELKFYRKMGLPIPRLHPDERHKDRMALRNPRTLWTRSCGDCGCDIQTTFAPDRPEKVLCEACYLKIVN